MSGRTILFAVTAIALAVTATAVGDVYPLIAGGVAAVATVVSAVADRRAVR